MNAKKKAAQIYDQYWSDVSRRPASNKDPLPDMRPLLEKAIIEAVEEEREACAKIADDVLLKTQDALVAGGASLIANRIRARSEAK